VTERYAHLRTDLFGSADLARVVVDLSAATAKILPLPAVRKAGGDAGSGAVGYAGVTHDEGGQPEGTVSQLDHSSAGVAKRYTQRTQNPPPVRAYEFKSRLRHQGKHSRNPRCARVASARSTGGRVPNGYYRLSGRSIATVAPAAPAGPGRSRGRQLTERPTVGQTGARSTNPHAPGHRNRRAGLGGAPHHLRRRARPSGYWQRLTLQTWERQSPLLLQRAPDAQFGEQAGRWHWPF
jgi:hypothetical protein